VKTKRPSTPDAPAVTTPPTGLPAVPPTPGLPLPSLPLPEPGVTTPTSQLPTPVPSLPLDREDVREILREVPELLRRP
jgi:hypothetical protein